MIIRINVYTDDEENVYEERHGYVEIELNDGTRFTIREEETTSEESSLGITLIHSPGHGSLKILPVVSNSIRISGDKRNLAQASRVEGMTQVDAQRSRTHVRPDPKTTSPTERPKPNER